MGRENPFWGDDWDEARAHWALDPTVTFLNHGSFGACPRPVLAAQAAWRARMEAQPVEFLGRRLTGMLDEARAAAGAFLRADPEGLAFVRNATAAVNSVLRALSLGPGDRVVVSDHAYPAVLNAARTICEHAGAECVVVPIPLPLPAPGEIVDAFAGALTGSTRLAIVDHVTSPTAAIFPVLEVVAACRARGVPVLVDAAHAPGMLEVDVGALGAEYWTGNFHKWVCAPKGAAALWVAPEHRARVRPLAVSHEILRTFHERFDWTGTDDPTPWLSVPDAIAFMGSLGWERVRAHNRALTAHGRALVADAVGTPRLVPADAAGSMAIVALPDGIATTHDDALALQARLYERARIEVPFVAWEGRGLVRISAQVYNAPADYERLAEALPGIV